MMKRQIITIAGRPGSGKSTTAKAVATKLGFEQFSSGSLFRELASGRGIDLLEANLTAEQNAEIDHLVDGRLREIGESGNKIIIDSRLAWHWMPESFKVFLNLDLKIAAHRILAQPDAARLADEHVPADPLQYARVLKSRLDSETRRYEKLYNVNPYDASNYDLVIDTETNSIEQATTRIIKTYQDWLNKVTS